MDLEILRNEEKRMNQIMFLFLAAIPVVAVVYVLLFNGGSARDAVALAMVAVDVVVKLLEKPLGKYAKYLYISDLPVVGAITIVLGNPASFGAMAEAYFLILFLAIPYYDLSVINVCVVVTVAANAVAMVIAPGQFMAMYTIPIWIFVLMVYILAVVVSVFIVKRALAMFLDAEKKKRKWKKCLEMYMWHLKGFKTHQIQSMIRYIILKNIRHKLLLRPEKYQTALVRRFSRSMAALRFSMI